MGRETQDTDGLEGLGYGASESPHIRAAQPCQGWDSNWSLQGSVMSALTLACGPACGG